MNQETVKSLLPKFIESLKELGRSPSTVLAYRADLQQLVDFLSDKNKSMPGEVEEADLESFRDFLLASNYTKKSTSRKLNAIKTFFRWMKDSKIITRDASQEVTHPKIETTIPKFLSALEYRALRDVVRTDQRVAAIVELILQTGLRISEVANLKMKDVKANSVRVEPYATQPERTVVLNEPARQGIEEYLKIRPETESDYLFVSKNGKSLAVRNIRAALDRHLQKAELPGYSVNDLRTTFIVENLKRGVDLSIVSQAAGHKRLSTTERYLELAEVKESGKHQKLEEL